MRIKSVRIENLRSFRDETIYLNDYTCMVGPNGAGKSTVLCALNIFFGEDSDSPLDLQCLEEEDFHQRDTSKPIVVTVTFCEMGEDTQEDLADYCRHGELVVSAVAEFDGDAGEAKVKQFGQRLGMVEFARFFKALSADARVAELKEIYKDLREAYPELPTPGTKDSMISSLREYEASRPDLCVLIPSADQFYGFRGTNKLAPYVQWVYIPALKDATKEQSEGRDTALGKLLLRTVRSKVDFSEGIEELRHQTEEAYRTLLGNNQGALDAISKSLGKRLSSWTHPGVNVRLEWRYEEGKSLKIDEPLAGIFAREGIFEGNIARFGHGLQRCYLLALLQELANSHDVNVPSLILGFEEPELFQHPPQAQHLSDVLQQLAEQDSQVLVCTHSPYFVSGKTFEDVRIVRKDLATSATSITQASFQDVSDELGNAGLALLKPAGVRAKIHQALQFTTNEMFFTPILVLVEGIEDIAYITSHLHLSGLWKDWRRLGCHMIPVNGKDHIIEPLAVANRLKIPTFVVFDSDAHTPIDKVPARQYHERDNRIILALCGYANENCMPNTTLWADNLVMWQSEVGLTVQAEFAPDDWERYAQAGRTQNGNPGSLNKNPLYIADLLSAAWDDGKQSSTLERLCQCILTFAETRVGHVELDDVIAEAAVISLDVLPIHDDIEALGQ